MLLLHLGETLMGSLRGCPGRLSKDRRVGICTPRRLRQFLTMKKGQASSLAFRPGTLE